MAIIPGVSDISELIYSWGLMFVVGIPLGAFWSARSNNKTHFIIPKGKIIVKRLFGGLGMGAYLEVLLPGVQLDMD